MIKPGDVVTHKTFPPVDGVVTGAQSLPNSEPKVAVMRDNGSLYWDLLSTWELVSSPNVDVDNSAAHEITTSRVIDEDDDIIDAEYTIIE